MQGVQESELSSISSQTDTEIDNEQLESLVGHDEENGLDVVLESGHARHLRGVLDEELQNSHRVLLGDIDLLLVQSVQYHQEVVL